MPKKQNLQVLTKDAKWKTIKRGNFEVSCQYVLPTTTHKRDWILKLEYISGRWMDENGKSYLMWRIEND